MNGITRVMKTDKPQPGVQAHRAVLPIEVAAAQIAHALVFDTAALAREALLGGRTIETHYCTYRLKP